MSTSTTILIKTDKTVKNAAKRAAEEIGIPLSTILSAYLRSFARDRRVEFEAPLVPNAKTRKAIADARAMRNLSKKHASVEAMFTGILGSNWREI